MVARRTDPLHVGAGGGGVGASSTTTRTSRRRRDVCGALTGEDEADERLRGDGADNLAIHAAVGPLLPEQVDVLGAKALEVVVGDARDQRIRFGPIFET